MSNVERMGTFGDDTTEEMCDRMKGYHQAILDGQITGVTSEEFLQGHPQFGKLFRGEQLSIFPGVDAPDGRLFGLDGSETSVRDICREARERAMAIQTGNGTQLGITVLLNFGSFT